MTDPNDNPLLILDLDETLIYSSEERLAIPHDFIVGPFFVHQRPGLERFVVGCAGLFQLAVWSSASADYVSAIVQHIFPPTTEPIFVWSRERCQQRLDPELREEYFLKDLKKVKRAGFDLDRVLVIEDTPQKVQRNYGNAIYVAPFLGQPDDELDHLLGYLNAIQNVPRFRKLEKRGWRSAAKGTK